VLCADTALARANATTATISTFLIYSSFGSQKSTE
jgi:hypothetical protein